MSKRYDECQKKIDRDYEAAERTSKRLNRKAKTYVLTINASDYVDSIDKKLSDYNFRLVEASETSEILFFMRVLHNVYRYPYYSAEANLTKKGEKLGAEVIVNVRSTISGKTVKHNSNNQGLAYLIGTALIPKNK